MTERKKKTFQTNRKKFWVLQEIKIGVSNQLIENKYNISERVRRRIVQHTDEITLSPRRCTPSGRAENTCEVY